MRGVFTKHYGDLLLFEDLEVEVLAVDAGEDGTKVPCR